MRNMHVLVVHVGCDFSSPILACVVVVVVVYHSHSLPHLSVITHTFSIHTVCTQHLAIAFFGHNEALASNLKLEGRGYHGTVYAFTTCTYPPHANPAHSHLILHWQQFTFMKHLMECYTQLKAYTSEYEKKKKGIECKKRTIPAP
jgi:hypothetical protein